MVIQSAVQCTVKEIITAIKETKWKLGLSQKKIVRPLIGAKRQYIFLKVFLVFFFLFWYFSGLRKLIFT